jgi:hypothetical protein
LFDIFYIRAAGCTVAGRSSGRFVCLSADHFQSRHLASLHRGRKMKSPDEKPGLPIMTLRARNAVQLYRKSGFHHSVFAAKGYCF